MTRAHWPLTSSSKNLHVFNWQWHLHKTVTTRGYCAASSASESVWIFSLDGMDFKWRSVYSSRTEWLGRRPLPAHMFAVSICWQLWVCVCVGRGRGEYVHIVWKMKHMDFVEGVDKKYCLFPPLDWNHQECPHTPLFNHEATANCFSVCASVCVCVSVPFFCVCVTLDGSGREKWATDVSCCIWHGTNLQWSW